MGKVTQVESAQAFCDLLAKSRLLTREQVAQALKLCNESTPAKALARRLITEKWLTTWQAVQLLAGRHVMHVGKYVLRDVIAEGELGRIFVAQNSKLDRQVAIKVLSSRHFQQPESIDRFLTEARAAAALDHPNILRVFDVDKEGERYFVVMEYVSGRDLQTVVENDGPLSFAKAADYIRQAAHGLVHAHEKGIIHRDVSPANLMVDELGVVKILNLGIGGLAVASRNTSDDAEVRKAARFSPPEQGGVPDARIDIYALGATLFYLITGQTPVAGDDPAQPVRDILGLRPDTPTPLAKICTKMLLPNPADRFQSVEPIEAILTRWLVEFSQKPASADNTVAAFAQAAVDARTFVPTEVRIERQRRVRKGEAPTASVRRTPLGLIISVVSAVLLVVCLAIALVLFVFRPGQATKAVDAQGRELQVRSVTSTDAASSERDPLETDPAASHAAQPPASGITVVGQAGQPTAKAQASQPQPTQPETPKTVATGQAATEGPAGTELAANGTSTGSTASAPPTPTATTPSAVPSGSPISPAPQPEPPKPTEPPPAGPGPATLAKPAPESSVPGTETAAPAADPFVLVPPSVTLPPLGKTAEEVGAQSPLALGELPPGTPLALELLGGDEATRNQLFTLRTNPDPDSGWRVHLGKPKAPDGGRHVAMLAIHENRLEFQWQPEAAKESAAPYLCNCVLRLIAGQSRREVLLRQPLEVEPLLINFEKMPIKQEWALTLPPNEQNLRLFVKLDATFPEHTFEPPPPILAKKGVTHMTFGKDPALVRAELDLETAIRHRLQVELSASLKPANSKPSRLTQGGLKKAQTSLAGERKQIEQQLPILKNQHSQTGDNAALKQELAMKMAAGEDRKIILAREAEQLGALSALYDQTQDKGRVHCRVFFLVGTTEVDILRTKGGW